VRVVIDGQFRSLPPSGTGTYLEQLLTELPRVAPDDEFIAVDPALASRSPRGGRLLPASFKNDARIRRLLWETAGFEAQSRAFRPDLLHIPSFAAPLRSTTPFVVTIHDAIPFVLPAYQASRPMRIHLALMKRTTTRASLVLTPSHAAAGDLHRVLDIPRERIRVTPEAADPRFRPAESRTLRDDLRERFGLHGPYIFNVGGLDVRKRVDLLIEAFALARHRLPAGTKLVIGGKAHSGNLAVYPPLEPLIDDLGVGNDMVLTGWLDDDDKLALYQAADAYVTPSIYEGFGLTPLEAMACGAPVVAANRTSFPEVIGDAGLLVEPEVRALSDAIARLLNDPVLQREFSARGLSRAATFSRRRMAEQTVSAYREAIELARTDTHRENN
jgi:glycosyltransferase involved in cell wall biosynthesis